MKECSYETILGFIKSNYEGNILVNGSLQNHDFILNKESENQPKQIMLFLDNEHSRRDRSEKRMFPEIETLLVDCMLCRATTVSGINTRLTTE